MEGKEGKENGVKWSDIISFIWIPKREGGMRNGGKGIGRNNFFFTVCKQIVPTL